MTTSTLTKNLLGFDPYEQQLQQQKLWAGLYGSSASPYEKMGIALGQLGGALLGGESAQQSQAQTLNKVLAEVGKEYTPNSPEYFRAVAEKLPADMANAKAYANQLANETETKAMEQEQKLVEYFTKNPQQATVTLQGLQDTMNKRLVNLGYDPTKPDEIPQKVLDALDKTPEMKKYKAVAAAMVVGTTEDYNKAVKGELDIENLKTTIQKNKAELGQIGNKLDEGQRWNMEKKAAEELFAANNLDPKKPLKGSALVNTALVAAQKIALRDPWIPGGKVTKPETATYEAKTLPSTLDAKNLNVGEVYKTPKGDARWDGSKFTPVGK